MLATWAKAKIGPDIHARVGKVLYSLPWRHIGKTADVRVTDTMVQFFIGGELVKTHPRKAGASRPTSAITRRRRSRSTCAPRRGAASRPPRIGPACEQVIAELLADNALYRLRAAQGVVGLADRHDPSRLEAACAKAIAAGDPSYRTVKGILAAGTDRELPAAPAAGDGGAGAFLHGAGVVRQRGGHARHDHQRRAGHARRSSQHRPGPRYGHDRRRRHDPGPAAGRPGARAARGRGVHRARRDQPGCRLIDHASDRHHHPGAR